MKIDDVSSSEIAPSYGEVMYDLNGATHKLTKMSDAATARGDTAGSAAWAAALALVESATRGVSSARDQQTWAAKRTAVCESCKR